MNITPISQSNTVNFKHKYNINPLMKHMKIIENGLTGKKSSTRLSYYNTWLEERKKNLGKERFSFREYTSYVSKRKISLSDYKKNLDMQRIILLGKILEDITGINNYAEYFADTCKTNLNNKKQYQALLEQFYRSLQPGKSNTMDQVYSLKNGEVTAKLFYDSGENGNYTDDTTIMEPTIVVKRDPMYSHNIITNPNVIGILCYEHVCNLCHLGTQLRNNTKICGHIIRDEILEQLKNLNGQYVHIKLHDHNIDIEPATKETLSEPIKYLPVQTKQMDFCDEILTSEQYKPNLVGPKAYNLHRLENMVKDKKIDVKIPPSIALPYGFLNKMLKYNEEQMNDVIQKLKENNIDSEWIMVRSAFNDEDLANFSAAGLHSSSVSKVKTHALHDSICRCFLEKNSYTLAYLANYGIKYEDIKPSIILQQDILPDYKFTLYTKYKDKLRIEFASSLMDYACGDIYIAEYDRNSGECINLYRHFADDNWPGSDKYCAPFDISKDKDLLDKLDKVVKNAMIIEKEFGHPQDIEGGLVGDDVWLWQTRNIVESV